MDAQYNLGIMFSNREGKGMGQHLLMSYMWYEIAAQNGLAEARKAQRKMVPHMTQAQVDEAKIKARQWLLKYGMKD